jgi:hypothetical protein
MNMLRPNIAFSATGRSPSQGIFGRVPVCRQAREGTHDSLGDRDRVGRTRERSVSARRARWSASTAVRTPSSSSPIVTTATAR